MLLAVLLIHSDSHGSPNVNGGHLHFVVGCDTRAPVSVSQMRLLARYLNMACGVAAVESCGRTMGKPIPADQTIENDEGNTGGGCGISGLLNGLRAVGLIGTAQHATPGRLWIMNVASGSITPPAQSQPYLDAAAVGWPDGWCVTIDMPGAQPQPPAPPPPPPPPKGVAMHWLFWHDVTYNGKPVSAAFLSDGRRYWWLPSEAVVGETRYIYKTAEAACGFKLLIEYNQVGTPMADLSAFGLPDNQATADLVGLPYRP